MTRSATKVIRVRQLTYSLLCRMRRHDREPFDAVLRRLIELSRR
jgi:predicted CopG family antitoxin